jgi:hypothetical protein
MYELSFLPSSSRGSLTTRVYPSPIKLWLDDHRTAPPGWTAATTVSAAIDLLNNHPVEAISLDHDLENSPDGLALVEWMLKHGEVPAAVSIHSWNAAGVLRMKTRLEDHGHHVTVQKSWQPPSGR